MGSLAKPKRFIAGAVCPKCSEMDKTVMYANDEGEEVRECIACGFSQTSTEQAEEDAKAAELATRVTPVDGQVVRDEDVVPLKIMGLGGTVDSDESDEDSGKTRH